MKTKCRNIREQLSEFLDGVLPEETAREVSAHVRECSSCRLELEGLRDAVQALNDLPTVPAPEALHAAVMDKLAGGSMPAKSGLVRVCLRLMPVAALFVAVVGVTFAVSVNLVGGAATGSTDPFAALPAERPVAGESTAEATETVDDIVGGVVEEAHDAMAAGVTETRDANAPARQDLQMSAMRGHVQGGGWTPGVAREADAETGRELAEGVADRVFGSAGGVVAQRFDQVLSIRTDAPDRAREELASDEVAGRFIVADEGAEEQADKSGPTLVLRIPAEQYDNVLRRLALGTPPDDNHALVLAKAEDRGKVADRLRQKTDWYEGFREGIVAQKRANRAMRYEAPAAEAVEAEQMAADAEVRVGRNAETATDRSFDAHAGRGVGVSSPAAARTMAAEDTEDGAFVSILVRFLPPEDAPGKERVTDESRPGVAPSPTEDPAE